MTRLIWAPVLMRLDFHDSICKWRLLYLSSSLQRDQEKKAINIQFLQLLGHCSVNTSYHITITHLSGLCSSQSQLNLRAGLRPICREALEHSSVSPPAVILPSSKAPLMPLLLWGLPWSSTLVLPFLLPPLSMRHLINSALYYNQMCACFSKIAVLRREAPLSVSFASSGMKGRDLPKELINQHCLHRLKGKKRSSLPPSSLPWQAL